MKKFLSILLSMVVLVSAINSSIISAFAGSTVSSAQVITLGNRISGSTNYSTKKQYYKFTTSSSGKVSFEFSCYTENSVYYTLLDNNLEELDYSGVYCNENLGYGVCDKEYYLVTGTYYLCVNCLEDSYSFCSYDIYTNFESANESFKESQTSNNNLMGSANAISLNKTYKGQLGQNDAVDFCKFSLSSSKVVRLTMKAYAESTVYFSLLDSKGNELEYSGIFPNDNLGYCYGSYYFSLAKGTYYIKFQSFDSDIRFGFYNYKVASVTSPKPTIKSVSAGKKKFTVKWAKKSCSGYQIRYSRSKSFSSYKSVSVSKNSTSKKISGLKSKKKYYVKIRTYKKVTLSNGTTKKVYSSWSSVKKITTK